MTNDNEQQQPNIQDLINTCIGEKPDEFAARFNELMRNRLSAAIDGHKVEMSQTLFGTPEGQTDIDDAIQQAHDETDKNDDVENVPETTEE
jgi:hypothetical protein